MKKLTELQYLRQKVELLQSIRHAALNISDHMRRSPAGDCFTYEGGMNDVESFRDAEAELVSFEYEHDEDDE